MKALFMRRKVVAVPSATTSRAKVSKRENTCRGGGRVMRDTRVDSALEPKLRGILMALKDCLVNENSRKGRIHPGVMVKQLWKLSTGGRDLGLHIGLPIPLLYFSFFHTFKCTQLLLFYCKLCARRDSRNSQNFTQNTCGVRLAATRDHVGRGSAVGTLRKGTCRRSP